MVEREVRGNLKCVCAFEERVWGGWGDRTRGEKERKGGLKFSQKETPESSRQRAITRHIRKNRCGDPGTKRA
jgi:hypothetical protein